MGVKVTLNRFVKQKREVQTLNEGISAKRRLFIIMFAANFIALQQENYLKIPQKAVNKGIKTLSGRTKSLKRNVLCLLAKTHKRVRIAQANRDKNLNTNLKP